MHSSLQRIATMAAKARLPVIESLLLLSLLFGFLALGVPVHASLGLSGLIVFFSSDLPLPAGAHTILNGANSFPLIAIPFFIFAGELMNRSGVTDRIFGFARALVGWLPGGLGHVNVASSVVFAGMSGAAVADAGGLGAVEIKAMRDAGYDKPFAVGVTAASSIIGPIIPPSLALIIYGVVADVSIGQLFAAGIIPGLLMAIALMGMVTWFALRRNYPKDPSFSMSGAVSSARSAFLPLLTPVIIIGGIVTGMFTPTEAAIAAVLYTALLGVGVYRSLGWSAIVEASLQTVKTSASVLVIVASAALFAWILTANQAAEVLSESVLNLSSNPTIVLLLMMAIVLVMGFFMETIAAITILVPLFLPAAAAVGIDLTHLGILMVLNLMIGLLTPPIGMVLYVLAKVSETPFEDCVKATAPFLVPLVAILLLLVVFPGLVLWLPNLAFQ